MSASHFFETMEAFFAAAAAEGQGRAAAIDALRAQHPGWDVSPERLAIYARFVDGHVRDTLAKNFPLTREVVGAEAWAALVYGYSATGPARQFEMNQLCAAFPAFVADEVARRSLPGFAPALARFEWADFEVYASPEEIPPQVDALTANPTLTVLQHPWHLVPWLRAADAARPAAPAPGDETILLWRSPSTHRTLYRAANASALLVLKMAVEGLSVDDAAAGGGLEAHAVRAMIAEHAGDGLVLAPTSRT